MPDKASIALMVVAVMSLVTSGITNAVKPAASKAEGLGQSAPPNNPDQQKNRLKYTDLPTTIAPANGEYSAGYFVENTSKEELPMQVEWVGPVARTVTIDPTAVKENRQVFVKLTVHGNPPMTKEKGILRLSAKGEETIKTSIELAPALSSTTVVGTIPAVAFLDAEQRYVIELFVQGTKENSPAVRATWTGSRTGERQVKVEQTSGQGLMATRLVVSGPPVTEKETGYLRLSLCSKDAAGSERCTTTDSQVELPAVSRTLLDASLLWIPFRWAAGSIVLAIVVVGLVTRRMISPLEAGPAELKWKIGTSFSATLAGGLTILNALTALGLSLSVQGQKYTPSEYTAWTSLYALTIALAPMVFGLLLRFANGQQVGTFAGFVIANLLNLFGAFGQLWFSRELIGLLGRSSILNHQVVEALQWLPTGIMVCMVWYVYNSFLAIGAAADQEGLGGAAAPGWKLL